MKGLSMLMFIGAAAVVMGVMRMTGYSMFEWKQIVLALSYPAFYIFMRIHAHCHNVERELNKKERGGGRYE